VWHLAYAGGELYRVVLSRTPAYLTGLSMGSRGEAPATTRDQRTHFPRISLGDTISVMSRRRGRAR
jgi:hypothetical protein